MLLEQHVQKDLRSSLRGRETWGWEEASSRNSQVTKVLAMPEGVVELRGHQVCMEHGTGRLLSFRTEPLLREPP